MHMSRIIRGKILIPQAQVWKGSTNLGFHASAFWGQSFVKELKRVGEEPERAKRFGSDPPPIRIDWRSYDGPGCCM